MTIENRPHETGDLRRTPRQDLLSLHQAALAAVDPFASVQRTLRAAMDSGPDSAMPRLGDFQRIAVIGAGKATARMAKAAEEMLGSRISEGVIVVKHGHTEKLGTVRQIEASHPVPDEDGVRGTREVLDLVRRSGTDTLLLCLLSGGGSALLVAPASGLELSDKQAVTDLLLKAGASIDELNTVRKHLSAVKGGRLAREASAGSLVSLILSDVIGDRLEVIASGPTVPDSTTFADAAKVIAKYKLSDRIPPRVAAYLERGTRGQEPETMKRNDPAFERVRNVIVGSNQQALDAARDQARLLGYQPAVFSTELQGDARDAARVLAERALILQENLSPADRICLLAGGETTVAVQGTGKGGRNQEMALAFALEIAGRRGITFLSAGTDGNDGPTDAAGAMTDGMTVARAREHGLEPGDYLANNDSYTFFQRFEDAAGGQDHLRTGPTGTNVMDLQYVIVEGRS